MKIYTKTGDKGETSLYKGGRVPKDAPRLEAYGTLDELNSVLGQALSALPEGEWQAALVTEVHKVQKDLFSVGAMLATRGEALPAWHIVEADVTLLEEAIDRMETELPPLTTFILPGGHPVGAALHLARTVCRRAERGVVGIAREEALHPLIGIYLNRLSDYLFVLARYANRRLGRPEAPLVM
ncbi:MAG: cob(I)yrinic acid a,c-diamide adenosyltransferase [Candidatus Sericytochromatia bacterium]